MRAICNIASNIVAAISEAMKHSSRLPVLELPDTREISYMLHRLRIIVLRTAQRIIAKDVAH